MHKQWDEIFLNAYHVTMIEERHKYANNSFFFLHLLSKKWWDKQFSELHVARFSV
jgi:hypothetical protein